MPNIIMRLLKLFLTLSIVLLLKDHEAVLQLLHSLAGALGGLAEQRHGQEEIGLSGIIRILYSTNIHWKYFDLCTIISPLYI